MFYFQRDLNNSWHITKQFKCGLKKRERERSERHFRVAINMTSLPLTRCDVGDRRAGGAEAQWQPGSIEQNSGGIAQLGQENSRSL